MQTGDTPSVPASTCTTITQPPPDENLVYSARNALMTKLLTHALLCDKTRVFSYMFNQWHSDAFTELGVSDRLHSFTHDEPGEQPNVHKHVVFIMQQLAVLLDALQAAEIGDGTLLDLCAILCTSDHGHGFRHSNDVPVMVAGKAGGSLRVGYHHASNGENPVQVHLALLRAVGCPDAGFGHDNCRVTTPYPMLMA